MKTRAFTLIEALAVVVIIGVLATILYPSFVGMRLKAQLKEVENTVEMIRAAEKYYKFKTGNYLLWTYNEAAVGYPNVGPVLHITFPPPGNAMCLYRVYTTGTETRIRFRNNDVAPFQNQGHYVIEDTTGATTDTYDIDNYNGKWEAYLLYLE